MNTTLTPTRTAEQCPVRLSGELDRDVYMSRANINAKARDGRDAHVPLYAGNSMEERDMHGLSGEVALSKKYQNNQSRKRSHYKVKYFTSFNQEFVPRSKIPRGLENDRDVLLDKVNNDFRVSGIVHSDESAVEITRGRRRGCAITVGGLRPVYNTATEPIFCGDIVIAEAPRMITDNAKKNSLAALELPRTKILPHLKRLDPNDSYSHTTMRKYLKLDASGAAAKTPIVEVDDNGWTPHQHAAYDLSKLMLKAAVVALRQAGITDPEAYEKLGLNLNGSSVDTNGDTFERQRRFLAKTLIDDPSDGLAPEYDHAAQNGINGPARMFEEIRNRIVGVAMGHAQPGEALDLLLGHYQV